MDPEMYEVARLSMGLRYANELKRQLERGEIDYSAPDHRQADGGSSNSGQAAASHPEAEENGAVSPATISRYMESVDNWLGNRKYKEEIQPHFKAMMELGISYEAAKPHIESGNLEFYKSM